MDLSDGRKMSERDIWSSREREIIPQLDRLLEPWRVPDSPGCAVGIIAAGETVLARGYGMANLEHGIPISSASVFRIASTSKQFTACCILLLAERGELEIDGDIREILPELGHLNTKITARHLLYHTSGIRDYLTLLYLPGMDADDCVSDTEVFELLCRQRALNFPPGERYMYCNSGYFLLSVIVNRLSGISLRKFADRELFTPLAMTRTHFHDDHTEIVPGRASGYSPRDGGGYQLNMTNTEIVGDGGAFTSIEDVLRWIANFRSNRLGLGSPELIRKLHTPGFLNDGQQLAYAMGVFVSPYRGLKMISHSGAYAGFRAEVLWFPERDVGLACLANDSSIEASDIARRIADEWFCGAASEAGDRERTVARPFSPIPSRMSRNWSGFYSNPVTGNIWEIVADDDKLTAAVVGGQLHELQAQADNHFTGLDAPFEIELRLLGNPPGDEIVLKIHGAMERQIVLRAVDTEQPSVDQYAECVGHYYSDELRLRYSLSYENGHLHIDAPDDVVGPLRPIHPELFQLEHLAVAFFRGEHGGIAGFKLSTSRVRNILFRRLTEGEVPDCPGQ